MKSFGPNGRLGYTDCGDRERRRHHHQRVAVRRRLEHVGGADGRARAALVLDDERLAELDRQLLADDARHDVGGAARRRTARRCAPGGSASWPRPGRWRAWAVRARRCPRGQRRPSPVRGAWTRILIVSSCDSGCERPLGLLYALVFLKRPYSFGLRRIREQRRPRRVADFADVQVAARINPWTIPNAIGFARLALVPVFLAVALSSGDGTRAHGVRAVRIHRVERLLRRDGGPRDRPVQPPGRAARPVHGPPARGVRRRRGLALRDAAALGARWCSPPASC